MARRKLGEILISVGLIDQAGLQAALAEQQRWGGPLGRILIDMRLVAEENLIQALSQQLAVPIVELDKCTPDGEVLRLVSPEFALDNSVIPFARSGSFLDLAMTDPHNQGVADELRLRTRLNIRPHIAGPKAIERALARLYGRGPGMMTVTSRPANAASPNQSGVWGELELEPSRVGSTVADSAPTGVPRKPISEISASAAAAASSAQKEIRALQSRITKLEGLVNRDEDVLRKLLALLVDKGVASREEILEYLR